MTEDNRRAVLNTLDKEQLVLLVERMEDYLSEHFDAATAKQEELAQQGRTSLLLDGRIDALYWTSVKLLQDITIMALTTGEEKPQKTTNEEK